MQYFFTSGVLMLNVFTNAIYQKAIVKKIALVKDLVVVHSFTNAMLLVQLSLVVQKSALLK